jgi:hypothetical protein
VTPQKDIAAMKWVFDVGDAQSDPNGIDLG